MEIKFEGYRYHVHALAGDDRPWGWKATLECHSELGTYSPENDEHFESLIQNCERRIRRKYSKIDQGGEFR